MFLCKNIFSLMLASLFTILPYAFLYFSQGSGEIGMYAKVINFYLMWLVISCPILLLIGCKNFKENRMVFQVLHYFFMLLLWAVGYEIVYPKIYSTAYWLIALIIFNFSIGLFYVLVRRGVVKLAVRE